jgi:hypothetical protein
MEDFAGDGAVLPTMSEGLEVKLSDFEAENATLKVKYLRQVVGIVIRCIPTVLEVHFMYMFMSLGRILLQGSVSTNLFDPMRLQVYHRETEFGMQLLGIIYLVADIILPGVHFTPLLGWRPRFSI